MWKQKETGEPNVSVMREDGGSGVRTQSGARAVGAQEEAGDLGRLVWCWLWNELEAEGMNKGNFIWCICGSETKDQLILEFLGT